MENKLLHELISKTQPNICQVSAMLDGKLIYSDCWNNYTNEDALHVMSVTKSIVSLLIGMCIDKGYIKSLDQKVLEFFPKYKIKKGEHTIQEVTIRNLMEMKAPYKYKSEPWTKICTSDNWTYKTLDLLGGKKGLTGEYRYSTLGIHILSAIIAKTSHLTPTEFANIYLFQPLGIHIHKNFIAHTALEHKEFTLSKKPKDHVWFVDNDDIGTAGYGLTFSSDDLVKIGQLLLNDGMWDDQRIISKAYIDEMKKVTTKDIVAFGGMSYGLLWWILDEEKRIYAALGNSGNVLYINPKLNLTVAVTSYFKPTILDRVEFIEKEIIPVLLKEEYVLD